MTEFRVTFGLKYGHREHPTFPAASPRGWLTILARDMDAARMIAHAALGEAWAFLYPVPIDEASWGRLYPLGEIARIDASLSAVAVGVLS